METYVPAKPFAVDPNFSKQREKALADLDLSQVDSPIVDFIKKLNALPYCFSLQCCYGHFVHEGQPEGRGVEPLAKYRAGEIVEYRIAYLAVCLQNNEEGRRLRQDLQQVAAIDPENIQFGSAEWFWAKNVNTYVLQVEPDRFRNKDTASVGIEEALHLEIVKQEFFTLLHEIITRHSASMDA